MEDTKKSPIIFIVITVVVLMVAVGIIFAISGGKKENTTSTQTTPTTTQTSIPTTTSTVAPSVTTTLTPSITLTPTTTTTITPPANVGPNDILVYFSKNGTEPSAVVPVVRPSDKKLSQGEAIIFAMNALLNGPKDDEKAAGLYVPFSLTGSSTCEGGYTYRYEFSTQTNLVVILCKDIQVVEEANGGTAGSSFKASNRVLNVIVNTMKKIENIKTVSVKDKNGNCYGKDGDGAGLNSCNM